MLEDILSINMQVDSIVYIAVLHSLRGIDRKVPRLKSQYQKIFCLYADDIDLYLKKNRQKIIKTKKKSILDDILSIH